MTFFTSQCYTKQILNKVCLIFLQAFLRACRAFPGVHPVDSRPRDPFLNHVRHWTEDPEGSYTHNQR